MRKLLIAAAAAGALGAVAPALAQPTVGQVTVTGALYENGRPVSLSRVVSYADLDLRSQRDQDVLRDRVNATARDICDQLGEDRPNHTNLGRSCQTRAVDDAMIQVRSAVVYAMNNPPAYAAVAPPSAAYAPPAAPAAGSYAANTSATPTYTTQTVTNGPVPDTPANRARYGQPMSNAGKRTAPAGN